MAPYNPFIRVMETHVERDDGAIRRYLKKYHSLNLGRNGQTIQINLSEVPEDIPFLEWLKMNGYVTNGEAVFSGTLSRNGRNERYEMTIKKTGALFWEKYRIHERRLTA